MPCSFTLSLRAESTGQKSALNQLVFVSPRAPSSVRVGPPTEQDKEPKTSGEQRPFDAFRRREGTSGIMGLIYRARLCPKGFYYGEQ